MGVDLRKKLEDLPRSAGVYLFKGQGGEILYVGKARSLRSRVRSYFQEARVDSPRLDRLVDRVEDVEMVVTDTEREALVLENSLIKTHKPRFNVLLRDDKNHPYLKLTLEEGYPRLYIVRQPAPTGTSIPGRTSRRASRGRPRTSCIGSSGSVTARRSSTGRGRGPACSIRSSAALPPCVDTLVSLETYRKAAEDARLFLEGRNDDLIASLKSKMLEEAGAERFEEAARLRDNVRMLEDLATTGAKPASERKATGSGSSSKRESRPSTVSPGSFARPTARQSLIFGTRPDLWGRGYAFQAASAVVAYAFETLSLTRVIADVDEPNTASTRVLEKMGMRRTGRRIVNEHPSSTTEIQNRRHAPLCDLT